MKFICSIPYYFISYFFMAEPSTFLRTYLCYGATLFRTYLCDSATLFWTLLFA
nr:MAG TPA: hypothetical protein [Bacteriophage sp.]